MTSMCTLGTKAESQHVAHLEHFQIGHVGHEEVVEAFADGSLHRHRPLVVGQGQQRAQGPDGALREAPLAHGCLDLVQEGLHALAAKGDDRVTCTQPPPLQHLPLSDTSEVACAGLGR